MARLYLSGTLASRASQGASSASVRATSASTSSGSSPGAGGARCGRPPAGAPPRRAPVVLARRPGPGASRRATSASMSSAGWPARTSRSLRARASGGLPAPARRARRASSRRALRRRRSRFRGEIPPWPIWSYMVSLAAGDQEQQRHHDREGDGPEDDEAQPVAAGEAGHEDREALCTSRLLPIGGALRYPARRS